MQALIWICCFMFCGSSSDMELEYRGRSGGAVEPMSIDDDSSSKLRAKGGIKKRGKSKSRLKKDKRKQKKLNF